MLIILIYDFIKAIELFIPPNTLGPRLIFFGGHIYRAPHIYAETPTHKSALTLA